MHLLLVEEEEGLARALKRSLELRGFGVDWLADSERARTRILLYQDEYDLVILDATLSGMSGSEIAQSVRKEKAETPIVMLTDKSDTEHKIDLLQKGANDYVIKPFVFDDLLSRINAVLRRPPPASRTSLVVAGDLEMDLAARVVRRSGREIPMTLKEFSLLECFMREPNVVLSREKLFECAWGLHSFSWSNVLDVHMKNLRKKINTKDSNTFFETVRGVGYRLRVPVEASASAFHARFMKPV